jgi:hypothetical protein
MSGVLAPWVIVSDKWSKACSTVACQLDDLLYMLVQIWLVDLKIALLIFSAVLVFFLSCAGFLCVGCCNIIKNNVYPFTNEHRIAPSLPWKGQRSAIQWTEAFSKPIKTIELYRVLSPCRKVVWRKLCLQTRRFFQFTFRRSEISFSHQTAINTVHSAAIIFRAFIPGRLFHSREIGNGFSDSREFPTGTGIPAKI